MPLPYMGRTYQILQVVQVLKKLWEQLDLTALSFFGPGVLNFLGAD